LGGIKLLPRYPPQLGHLQNNSCNSIKAANARRNAIMHTFVTDSHKAMAEKISIPA